MIRVADGHHLWSKAYERDRREIFGLSGQIAAEIASVLNTHPTHSHASPGSDAGALDLFWKGRHEARKWTGEGLKRGIEYLERATVAAPNCAQAHAELADAYCHLAVHGTVPATATMPKAKAAAHKAVALDNTLAHAHAALALVSAVYEWEWGRAEVEFQRALQLDPHDSFIRETYVMGYLLPRGRFEEAGQHIRRARELDPVSARMVCLEALLEYYSGRFGEAGARFRQAIALDPNFEGAQLGLALAGERQSLYPEAIAAARKGQAAWSSEMGTAFLAHIRAAMGQPREARAMLEDLRERSRTAYVSPVHIALVSVALGDNEAALAALEKAYEEHAAGLVYLKINPRFEKLRPEPRFRALVKKIGLE